MKSRDGTSQRSEEKKKEYQKRESLRRKKIQVREKVGKPRNTVFFQWFVAPEGRKVGSLKRRVRSQLARWEMKNCTPLWREAHFEVKSVENWRVRSTFGRSDVVLRFLRGVAFWSIRSSSLLRWFCVTGAALRTWQAQYFRQVEWKNRKTHWYEAVSAALNFAELFRFWCCQVQKLRKSRPIVSFLTLSSSRIEEVSGFQACR